MADDRSSTGSRGGIVSRAISAIEEFFDSMERQPMCRTLHEMYEECKIQEKYRRRTCYIYPEKMNSNKCPGFKEDA